MEPIFPAPTMTMSFMLPPQGRSFLSGGTANGRVVSGVFQVYLLQLAGQKRRNAMDVIDEKLISALRENGRASTAMLARLVGRSRTSVQSRIERLEKQGVITGYGVRLAPELGIGAVRAHVMIKVGPKETRAVTAALREISQVRLLHSVSGDVDLIAVAVTASVAEMDQVIDRIGALDGVERITSSIILSTKFER